MTKQKSTFKKNHFKDVIISRMNDVQYIKYLEDKIRDMGDMTEEFIQEMDKAVFERKGSQRVLSAYTKHVRLLTYHHEQE